MRGKREEGGTEERKEERNPAWGKKKDRFPKEKKGRIKVNYNKGMKSVSEGKKEDYNGGVIKGEGEKRLIKGQAVVVSTTKNRHYMLN